MWSFRKKLEKQLKPKLVKKEPERIEFSQEDNSFIRAKKILRLAGVIDHAEVYSRLAEGLEIYRQLDQKMVERGRQNGK